MSDKRPAFQWYPKDYLTDENVIAMTLEEEGAYRRLMDYCWLHGSLPDDMDRLGAMCKTDGSRMAELWMAIETCFQLRDGRWIHPRLELERRKQDNHRKAKSEAGRAGAKARWEKEENGTAIDLPMAKNSSSSAFASATAVKEGTTLADADVENSKGGEADAGRARLSGREKPDATQPAGDVSTGGQETSFEAIVGPIIREKWWQGDESPLDTTLAQECGMAKTFLRLGWLDFDGLVGGLGMYDGPPATMRLLRTQPQKLQELVGQWRKSEEARATKLGAILKEITAA